MRSPPARGRGLKQKRKFTTKRSIVRSPPARGRGLKLPYTTENVLAQMSPPAWGRGLKLFGLVS